MPTNFPPNDNAPDSVKPDPAARASFWMGFIAGSLNTLLLAMAGCVVSQIVR